MTKVAHKRTKLESSRASTPAYKTKRATGGSVVAKIMPVRLRRAPGGTRMVMAIPQEVLDSKIGPKIGPHVERFDRPSTVTFGELVAASEEQRMEAVLQGLAPKLADDAATLLGISQRAFLAAVGIAPTTFKRLRENKTALSRDDSDRLARLADVWHIAVTTLGDEENASAWITGRVPVLNAIPLVLLRTAQGYNQTRTALLQLAYGVYA